MLFKKIYEFFSKNSKLQEPTILALPSERIAFSHALSDWVKCNKNNDTVLLLDNCVLSFLKVNGMDYDYTLGTLVVVWGNWVIIGKTYSKDGRYAVLTEFITTSPCHGVVYKNDNQESENVKIFKLEEVQE